MTRNSRRGGGWHENDLVEKQRNRF